MTPKFVSRLSRRLGASPIQIPIFLVPSFVSPSTTGEQFQSQLRSYASHSRRTRLARSASDERKPKINFPLSTKIRHRDKNKKRGVSVIRSTGPKHTLNAVPRGYPLPVPASAATTAARRKQYKGSPNHGLWGFFYEHKNAMNTPEAMLAHGRAWTYQELSIKSFQDLHGLYWIGHKEQNRILTNGKERQRVHAGYGDYEDDSRLQVVQETNKTIREVLVDRYMSAQAARSLLEHTNLDELSLDEDDIESEGVFSELNSPGGAVSSGEAANTEPHVANQEATHEEVSLERKLANAKREEKKARRAQYEIDQAEKNAAWEALSPEEREMEVRDEAERKTQHQAEKKAAKEARRAHYLQKLAESKAAWEALSPRERDMSIRDAAERKARHKAEGKPAQEAHA